jgi:hypothetical protein
MKMNRRQFNTFAAVSAAGLVVPGLAQAQAKEKENTSLMASSAKKEA